MTNEKIKKMIKENQKLLDMDDFELVNNQLIQVRHIQRILSNQNEILEAILLLK